MQFHIYEVAEYIAFMLQVYKFNLHSDFCIITHNNGSQISSKRKDNDIRDSKPEKQKAYWTKSDQNIVCFYLNMRTLCRNYKLPFSSVSVYIMILFFMLCVSKDSMDDFEGSDIALMMVLIAQLITEHATSQPRESRFVHNSTLHENVWIRKWYITIRLLGGGLLKMQPMCFSNNATNWWKRLFERLGICKCIRQVAMFLLKIGHKCRNFFYSRCLSTFWEDGEPTFSY